jgi:hypothetical protein
MQDIVIHEALEADNPLPADDISFNEGEDSNASNATEGMCRLTDPTLPQYSSCIVHLKVTLSLSLLFLYC